MNKMDGNSVIQSSDLKPERSERRIVLGWIAGIVVFFSGMYIYDFMRITMGFSMALLIMSLLLVPGWIRYSTQKNKWRIVRIYVSLGLIALPVFFAVGIREPDALSSMMVTLLIILISGLGWTYVYTVSGIVYSVGMVVIVVFPVLLYTLFGWYDIWSLSPGVCTYRIGMNRMSVLEGIWLFIGLIVPFFMAYLLKRMYSSE